MSSPPAESPPLNPAQAQIVAHGLLDSGFHCVLQLPTGAGKTWLAQRAIAGVLGAGRRAIYLTPLRALAAELTERWKVDLPDHPIGIFTGDFGGSRAFPVPFARARLLVMTPERLDACTRHWRSHWSWIPEVDLIIVDELHLLGDPHRGPRLEGALSRIRRLNPFARIVGLSATLGNLDELTDWLEGVCFRSDWRPLPIEWRLTSFRKATEKPELLHEEVRRCVSSGGQSLVFVQSRRRAEQLAAHLSDTGIPAAHHHAGLEANCRRTVEDGFRRREIAALVATGTLEMGLNLPARQVVLYDLQGFDGAEFVPLPVNTVWQRAGRAGRRGLDDGGEVVLLAPAWDRSAKRYLRGDFEPIVSGLRNETALAEQILAEVASGLARTRGQLARCLERSLAHHQNRLPAVDRVVDDMVRAGMLAENDADTDDERPGLKATRIGRIAVRQMLSPQTVLRLAEVLHGPSAGSLTFFDLLLVAVDTPDCEPRLAADFEELEPLAERLVREPSQLLSGEEPVIRERFAGSGRRLLATIKTALVARAWTRTGCAETVADAFGVYAFEVRRLAESLGRILAAAATVATPPADSDESDTDSAVPELTTREKVKALAAMVAYGVDEEVVTLTYVDGIGGVLARRLRDADIRDIEELSLAEVEEVAQVRGVSAARAASWIERAALEAKNRSALALREDEPGLAIVRASGDWPASVDPYRLRRALDLVVAAESGSFRVSGGLEPHLVRQRGSDDLICDCADFAKGVRCKHLLAVRLHRVDTELTALARRMQDLPANELGFDLFGLWFEGGRR